MPGDLLDLARESPATVKLNPATWSTTASRGSRGADEGARSNQTTT